MFKDHFKERINELCREQGSSASAMAKKAGLAPGSMNMYLSGERCPDAERLYRICKAFSISADWLLGLSDVRTVDTDIHAACETLGLTEAAANTLLREQGEALNHFLERSDENWDLIRFMLENYLSCLKKVMTDDAAIVNETLPGIVGDRVMLSGAQAADYFARVVGDCVYKALVDEWKADHDQSERKE